MITYDLKEHDFKEENNDHLNRLEVTITIKISGPTEDSQLPLKAIDLKFSELI